MVGSNRVVYILDEDWTDSYAQSRAFQQAWKDCTEVDAPWPKGMQLIHKKLYLEGRLCVPEDRVEAVLLAFHVETGHPGVQRLVLASRSRFEFPGGTIAPMVQSIRKGCLVCQACESPNLPQKRPLRMNPVVEGFWASICLDIFSLPTVEWQGESYDGLLLCVDRATNWITARPTLREGLTGEKAVKLLLEGGWGEAGIPAIITSDQGTQFTSQFFRTICARLGVRQAFSQAYRPQANGRAEVAGRTLITVLRKLQADHEINWVEGLPRVLRLRHDLPDPLLGISPYQMVFGRERPLAGLPYSLPRRSPDADELCDGIAQIDEWALQKLRAELAREEEQINRSRPTRDNFKVGDWVWIQRPTAYMGPKIQTSWLGPTKIIERTGEHSFQVRLAPNDLQEVHTDQMKPCCTCPQVENAYPMVYRKGEPQFSTLEALVKRVVDLRETPEGFELLIEWNEDGGGGQSWLSAQRLGPVWTQTLARLQIKI